MSDETRERYISAVNIICEQFGFEKPSQVIYVCEAVDRLIEEYRKENAELKEHVSRAGYRIAELKHEIDEQKEKIADLESIIESLQSCTNCEHFDGDNYCKSKQCVIHQLDGYCPTWEKA